MSYCAFVAPKQRNVYTVRNYIHTTYALSPKRYQTHLRYSSETNTFYQNYLAMRNTTVVTGDKPILGCFGWVIVSRQLHFHIYYLFRLVPCCMDIGSTKSSEWRSNACLILF
jgi:hypothetical protein